MESEKSGMPGPPPSYNLPPGQYDGNINNGYQPQGGYPPAQPGTVYGTGAQQIPPQPGYVAPQQIMMVQQPGGPPPNSYLAFSIFTCLCCCWPVGIVAIIFSVMTSNRSAQGDYTSAQSSSKTALILSIVALVLGSICIITVIALAATGHLIVRRHIYYG